MGFDDFDDFEKWDYIVGDDDPPPRRHAPYPASRTPDKKSRGNMKCGIGCAVLLIIIVLIALFTR